MPLFLYVLHCVYAQLCPALWDFMDCSPPGSSVHGIFQPRILEQVVLSYSRESPQPRNQTHVSCIGRWVLFKTDVLCYLEKVMAPHSSALAWKIPWTEDPGGLQSMGSWTVGHDWATSLSLLCIGEGNGNPLQCSCLENPRDGGAW